MNDLTAAHRTLPLPSIVRVTNLENGRSIKLRVNDRGPFVGGRIIDVSRRAAQLLGFHGAGTARVQVDIVEDESRLLAGDLSDAERSSRLVAAAYEPPPPTQVATRRDRAGSVAGGESALADHPDRACRPRVSPSRPRTQRSPAPRPTSGLTNLGVRRRPGRSGASADRSAAYRWRSHAGRRQRLCSGGSVCRGRPGRSGATASGGDRPDGDEPVARQRPRCRCASASGRSTPMPTSIRCWLRSAAPDFPDCRLVVE